MGKREEIGVLEYKIGILEYKSLISEVRFDRSLKKINLGVKFIYRSFEYILS